MGRTKKAGSPQQPIQDGWQVFVEANDAEAGTLTHLVLLQPPTANVRALRGDAAAITDHGAHLGPVFQRACACKLMSAGCTDR